MFLLFLMLVGLDPYGSPALCVPFIYSLFTWLLKEYVIVCSSESSSSQCPDNVTAPRSRHWAHVTLSTPLSSDLEKLHIAAKNKVFWKCSPWSFTLSCRSRQAAYMHGFVLHSPSPQAGSAGRDRKLSFCLSLLNPLINRPLCLFYRQ